jgi:ribonucleoside-triphosphate reductase
MGAMLKSAPRAASSFNDMYVLNPVHAKAHREGDIHIHDLDFYTLDHHLHADRSVKPVPRRVLHGARVLREPNVFTATRRCAALPFRLTRTTSTGGQSIVNFDYGMAPGVQKTYYKRYRDNLARALELLLGAEEATDTAVALLAAVKARYGKNPGWRTTRL